MVPIWNYADCMWKTTSYKYNNNVVNQTWNLHVISISKKFLLESECFFLNNHNNFAILLCFGSVIVIIGVMASMLDSTAVYPGFKPWSSQTKDYTIGMCCFTKHAALKSKSKDNHSPTQYIDNLIG